MKNLLCSIALFTFLTTSAQNVERGNVVCSASPGIAFSLWDRADTAHISFTEIPGLRVPITVEYALNRYLGVSGDFVYTRLISAKTLYPSNFRILDFGVSLQLHSPSVDRHIHWTGAIGLHYSIFRYFRKGNPVNELYTANGTSLYFALGANTYLSDEKNFGIGLSLNGSGYKYPRTHYSNDLGVTSEFKMNGTALSLGINWFYKF